MRTTTACFASAVLLAIVIQVSAVAQRAPKDVPRADLALAREILAELVAIPTTSAEGTARAAETIVRRLVAAGVQSGDVRTLGPDPKTSNVVARLRGTGSAGRPVLFAAHLDVVPARREDWSVDPFTLIERDGWLYGRGSVDNKAGVAMLVANLIQLQRAGWRPARDLVVLVTGDEETSQRSIQWLVAEHRSLVDAELAFNTDSGSILVRKGKRLFFEVQASEKVYADYSIEATDIGGHSSLPRRENPITHVSAALVRIAGHDFPLHVGEVARAYLERTAGAETGDTARDMLAVARTAPDPSAAERLSRTPSYNALLRTTCVATRVEAGHANNALPQSARAIINCRILPGTDTAGVESVLRSLAGDKVRLSVVEPPVPSPPSPLTPAIISRLEMLVKRHWPGLGVVPTMATGATDGMYLRSAGIPTYGVSALEQDPDDARAHGKDERVGVTSFAEATEFWMDLMTTFGGQSP